MKLVLVGLGNMGVSVAQAALERGISVLAIDSDLQKLEKIRSGETYLNEPGSEEELSLALRQGSLELSDDIERAAEGEIIFIGVQTPEQNSECDYSSLVSVLERLSRIVTKDTPVLIGSTVFPGAFAGALKPFLSQLSICYQPVFLRAGNGKADYLNPGKLIVGSNKPAELDLRIVEFFETLCSGSVKLESVSLETSEWAKLIHNSLMCLKLNFANEIGHGVEERWGESGQKAYANLFSGNSGQTIFKQLLDLSFSAALREPGRSFLLSFDEERYKLIAALLRSSLDSEQLFLENGEETPISTEEALRALFAQSLFFFKQEFFKLMQHYDQDPESAWRVALTENERGRLLTSSHMRPGPPFSGPCLPKDAKILQSLIPGNNLAKQRAYPVLSSLWESNERYLESLLSTAIAQADGATLAVLGLSFRPDCPEYRGSFGLEILKRLKNRGQAVQAWDPFLETLDESELYALSRGDTEIMELLREVRGKAMAEVVQEAGTVLVNFPLTQAEQKKLKSRRQLNLYPA